MPYKCTDFMLELSHSELPRHVVSHFFCPCLPCIHSVRGGAGKRKYVFIIFKGKSVKLF